jgi:hypothetical protein
MSADKVSASNTLVFPAVTPEARDFCRRASAEGRVVVASASIETDRSFCENWENLPSVNDARFPDAFAEVVKRHHIESIYVPVASAYFFLQHFIAERMPQLRIINPSPFEVQTARVCDLLDRADRLLPFERIIAEGHSMLSREAIAGILRQAMLIHGESGEEKITAMMGIFARAPKGDVVEVGSLMGRTAAVMKLLADAYEIGPLLTADPWDEACMVQNDSPLFLQQMSNAWPQGTLPSGFSINMLGLGLRDHAHLRLPSTEAFATYEKDRILPGLGNVPVEYSGQIAVLHIDANHDYDQVLNDWQLWGSRLMAGGWIILDDYIWMHGEGPHRVGDMLLEEDMAATAFVCGKALFIQLPD